jgi:nucleoside-diphosphate-sugar epimerase
MTKPSLLILGRGYVGKAILEQCPHARWTTTSTFHLSNRASWKNEHLLMKPGDMVVWTFPAASTREDEDLAYEFYDAFLREMKVIIYGSTSSYVVHEKDEWVTESTTLNMNHIRTRTEETLRQKGACIVHLAGIFGPGRDPCQWYKKGLIHAGLSYLNLIHLQDIVSITMKLLACPDISGERYNLSNGRPQTHQQIVELLKKCDLLDAEFVLPEIDKIDSKRVSNRKIKDLLSLTDENFHYFP